MALDVGKKLGPLPIWVWMALAVLALLIWNQWKNSKSASSSTNGQNAPAQASLTAPGVTLIQEGFSGPPNNQSGGIPSMGSDNSGYIGTAYVVKPGDTLQSIMQQFYGSEANAVTARILGDANPGVLTWSEKNQSFTLPPPGTTIYLATNGVAGYQANTLNRYDPGHTLPMVSR